MIRQGERDTVRQMARHTEGQQKSERVPDRKDEQNDAATTAVPGPLSVSHTLPDNDLPG